MRQPRGIEDYDLDSVYIRSLAKAELIAKEREMAIEAALNSHPVTGYVKGCEVQELYGSRGLHPAISESHSEGKKMRYIEWGLPGRDVDLAHRMGCGFKTQDPERMVFTACPEHHDHYLKAARIHCWRLSCPNCMNDAGLALKFNRQILDFQYAHQNSLNFGFSILSNVCPDSVNPSSISRMPIPGGIRYHQAPLPKAPETNA